MANLNLGEDVAKKRETKWTAANNVAKSYTQNKLQECSLRFSY